MNLDRHISGIAMNATGRALTHLITQLLKPAGFKRVGDQWVFEGDEYVGAINLQKSDYKNSYYLNIAFAQRTLLPTGIPRIENFILYGRAGALPKCEVLDELRFPENVATIDDRTAVAVSTCFNGTIIPFVTSLVSRQNMRSFLDTELSRNFTGVTPDKILAELRRAT